MFKTIIIFLLILSVLVIIHELAHFFVAIWNKVWVQEFGVGFPPRIKTLFKWKNTKFSLNAIPIGGFVSMAGETYDDNPPPKKTANEETLFEKEKAEEMSTKSVKEEPAPKIPKSALFYNKKAWQRAAIIVAGPLSNIVFGAILFAIVFCIIGIPYAVDGAYVGYVMPNTPASNAGLLPNTKILAVTDATAQWQVTSTEELITYIGEHRGQEITITTTEPCHQDTCEGRVDHVTYVRTVEETPAGEGSVGIAFEDYNYQFYPWYQQIPYGIARGFQQSWEMIVLIIDSLGQMLGQLFTRQEASTTLDVVGPVGMVNQIEKQGLFDSGILGIVQFAAILSVNLGVMNLLPFPALDGGKLVMIGVGKIFGRKKVAKFESYLDMLGFALLIFLMLVVTTRDIWNIFK